MNKQIITFDANEQSLIKTGGVDKRQDGYGDVVTNIGRSG